jgi:tyrosine-protein phosphatase SIW14
MRNFPFVALLIFSSTLSAVPFRQSSAPSVNFASSSALDAEKISIPGIPNAGKISNSLFRGAQPDLSHLDELKKLGITTIVDLRSESSQTRAQEKLRAESLGMHFISIPVGGFSTPTSAQLAEFFSVVRETPLQKIFVHCKLGEDRTGVFIASYRIAFDHWTPDQAITEMLFFGFNQHWHPAMGEFVKDLPTRLQSDTTLKTALSPAKP